MQFNEYQSGARATAIYPPGWMYPAFGLAGEAGEVAGKCAKMVRDDDVWMAVKRKEEIRDELGDCLWMIANLAHELGYTLEDVAQHNLAKLADRAKRGVIKGAGDRR